MVYQPSPSATVSVHKPARPIPRTPDKSYAPAPEITSEPANVVRVRVNQGLAKVLAILLKDIVPLRADESEQAMTSEEYESRLNRAIEMELTFEAAAAQVVGLTAEQSKRLDRIAQKHEATFQGYRKQGITWSSLTAAQLDFEQRLTAALIWQQNLVASEAGVAPSPDAGMQARYEQALRAVLDRLKANANITLTSIVF